MDRAEPSHPEEGAARSAEHSGPAASGVSPAYGDEDTISVRSLYRKRGYPKITLLAALLAVSGLALGAAYIGGMFGTLTTGTMNTTSLDCGFVTASNFDSPSPSSTPQITNYITAPGLQPVSSNNPVSTVNVGLSLYDTGPAGAIYFDGEIGLGCSQTPTTGSGSLALSISSSTFPAGTTGTWVVLFVSPDSGTNGNDLYCSPAAYAPAAGTPSSSACPSTGTAEGACTSGVTPNLYLPNNGYDTTSNTLTWNWETGTSYTGCSSSAPTATVSSGWSTMHVLFDISFAEGGVTAISSSCSTSCASFTLTANAAFS